MLTYCLFALGLIFPLVWKFIFPHRITWAEYFAQTAVGVSIALLLSLAITSAATRDVELWSGEVTSKERVKVSCDHSYSCNCVTRCSGSGKDRTCSQVCQTCYEHNHDFDWRVRSNIGSLNIDRIDRQGKKEPPRFTEVKVGEPFVQEHSFTNYIKASPTTLFKDSESLIQPFLAVMPAYPEVFDYYRANRVYNYGITIDTTLNDQLNELMKKWGPTKQANVIAIFLGEAYTQDYFNALKAHWLGGKKNDVVLVTQLDSNAKVNWVRVMSRSESNIFNTTLEFDLGNMGQYDSQKFVQILDTTIMQKFQREDFHKYEYLLDEFQPSTVAIVFSLIFAFLVNGAMAFYTWRNDDF